MLSFLLFSIGCKDRRALSHAANNSDYKRGVSFYERQNDSAYFYFNRFVTGSRDSFRVAWAYNYMAIIQEEAGDYFGSQESLLYSLGYLHEERDTDRYCLTSDYNELGSNSLNLKNYDAAIDYYSRALKLAKDSASRSIALNDKAVAFEKKRQYAEAIAIYESVLEQSKKSRKEYARVLTNLAMARWMRDNSYRASADLYRALELREADRDDWGLNSSYAHLADYYLHSQPDSALRYAGEMYAMAQRLGSPDDELEALQKLIVVSNPKAVKEYFVRYQDLADSLQTARNGAKNQFALIRYDAQKNKEDNLRLQRENAEKRIEIIWQRGSIVIFVLFIVWLYTWFRRRARTRIRENRLQLSGKVHDEVANGIYRVMKAVQYEAIGKEQLVGDLDGLYKRSRDISYDREEKESDNMHINIGNLLSAFGGPATRVGIVGNDPELWAGVSDSVKREVVPMLQEIMVNMEKHSGASRVTVWFGREGGQLVIRYIDDGVGLPEDMRLGNGLTNTENRIKSLAGRFTFNRNLPNGLRIEIHLPIS